MNHQDFYFWLQGYFELRDDEKFLNHKQMETVQCHLNLVKKQDGPLRGFAAWLDGMFSAFKIACDGDNDYPDRLSFTNSIAERLNECFEHEVDSKYDKNDPDTKQELANIHKPTRPPFGPDTLIRC